MRDGKGWKRAQKDGRGRHRFRPFPSFSVVAALPLLGVAVPSAFAQVTISPSTTQPAAWEHFAVRVFGAGDTAVVSVRVEVPEVVAILGIRPAIGWQYGVTHATDTTPQAITWAGGPLAGLDYGEFAFLGRVQGDARRNALVFPVHVTLEGGETLHWTGSEGTMRPAPRVRIVERTQLSPRGAMAAAAVAVALSILALALTLARRRTDDTSARGTRP